MSEAAVRAFTKETSCDQVDKMATPDATSTVKAVKNATIDTIPGIWEYLDRDLDEDD